MIKEKESNIWERNNDLFSLSFWIFWENYLSFVSHHFLYTRSVYLSRIVVPMLSFFITQITKHLESDCPNLLFKKKGIYLCRKQMFVFGIIYLQFGDDFLPSYRIFRAFLQFRQKTGNLSSLFLFPCLKFSWENIKIMCLQKKTIFVNAQTNEKFIKCSQNCEKK